jgi:hypothetical protein
LSSSRELKTCAHPCFLTKVVSGFADFNMPQPFAPRVKNALDAEPRSVRLSNLVGAGGLWYGFGRMVVRLWVARGFAPLLLLRLWSRLDEERGVEMSNLFMTVRDNRHF